MKSAVLALTVLLATSAFAQESEKDYLTTFLEDSLSDAGRTVTVTGFAGALSSQATIESLTIADDNGVWLALEGLSLDWSRSALLSSELVVSELSARELVLFRLPVAGEDGLPSPEAGGFSLPELPVSIDIDKVAIDRIALDQSVLGQPVEGRLDAALLLASGSGEARLELSRTGDGPTGQIVLEVGFDNATQDLSISVTAGESAGGLVATALGIPGAPSSDFRLAGSGPLTAFDADILLATDGEERLTGKVSLSGSADGETRLKADLGGNLAPLFLPEYVGFLGSRLDVTLDARRTALGSIAVDQFKVTAQSLSAEGTAVIAADGLPESISLSGVLASPDGGQLLLPVGVLPTHIDTATFQLTTTKNPALEWKLTTEVVGLSRDDLQADTLSLSGSGRIGRTAAGRSFGGSFAFSAKGIAPTDPALAKAIGPEVAGGLKMHFLEGKEVFSISDLRLVADGLSGGGNLRVEGLETAFKTSGKLALSVEDLSRFDGLAGLPLAGKGEVTVEGSFSRLSGHLDGDAEISAMGLEVGIPQLDRLLQGDSTAHISLLRDEAGTTVRSLELKADSLTAAMAGKVASAEIDLAGQASITDLAALDPTYAGAVVLDVSVTGNPEAANVALTGTTEGLAVGSDPADRLLAGTSTLTADLDLSQDRISVKTLKLSNRQLDFEATGTIKETVEELSFTGKLADLGLLVPDLTGPLLVSGKLASVGEDLGIDVSGRGPGKLDAKIEGKLAKDLSTGDLTISGTGQAGLANIFIAPRVMEGPARFDLRLVGPVQLSSLTGRVTLSDARLSDPGLGFALEKIDAIADLRAGKAVVSATAGLSTGGKLRVDGPVGLQSPFAAELAVAVDQVRFFDPKLYETVLGGSLGITGPLAGGALISGALTLSQTDLRVPESGISAGGLLQDLIHRREPAEVRTTRVRAGLLDGESSTRKPTGTPFRLDLLLSAPSRIFLRGRGIDAELGGELRLGGTTEAVVPAGEFSLIRGRLDILGKRLVLDQADLVLEGSLVPQLEISASAETDGIRSSVTISGPADDPDVTFSSDPDLPQEEVLAHLLFGRGLDSISALQAAQLAQAVAVLAGKGGEGIVGKLRKSFGLDDLDLATAEDGTTALKAGKYIAENVYSEIEIDQTGTSKINLNLDLRSGVTVKGQLGADGDTGIGIFIENDY